MNKIIWENRAIKQLKKLNDSVIQERITKAVRSLADFPKTSNVKTLTNHDYDYRLRVGNYRVMFNHIETIQIISIKEVKKRDERTY